MGYPGICYECGGDVSLLARPGRTMRYRDILALDVPAELAIPTCEKCNDEYINSALAERLEQALAERYQMRKTNEMES